MAQDTVGDKVSDRSACDRQGRGICGPPGASGTRHRPKGMGALQWWTAQKTPNALGTQAPPNKGGSRALCQRVRAPHHPPTSAKRCHSKQEASRLNGNQLQKPA